MKNTSNTLKVRRASGMSPAWRNVLATIMLAFSAWTVESRATVINFDDVPGIGQREIAGSRYQSLGVLLSTTTTRLVVEGPAFWTNTPPNYLSTPEAVGDVAVEFVLPGTATRGLTRDLSFYVVGYPADPRYYAWTATVFAAGGEALESVSDTGVGRLVSFARPVAEIHSMVFHHIVGPAGIDTLVFGDIVPEPATWRLLLAGAVGSLLGPTQTLACSSCSRGRAVGRVFKRFARAWSCRGFMWFISKERCHGATWV